MNAKPYPKYKHSGVEWLGEVPEHWTVKAIKWESPVLRGASPRPIDNPIYFDDDEGEYAWVRISDVTTAGRFLGVTEQKLSELGSSLSVKLLPGSLFLSIAGSVGKPCVTTIKACIHDGFVYFPRWASDVMFLYYVFASGEPYRGLGKFGTQLNLNTETVGGINMGFPPKAEQQAIVDFLDDRTGKLDALLGKKRAVIGKLKEKRSALISRTVTKGLPPEAAAQAGLNPKPKLKPSGIPWLGDIPEHWDISKAGHFISITSGFAFPSDGFSHDENDTKLLRGVNIGVSRIRWDDTVYWPRKDGDQLKRYELKAGDLVLGMDRPWISEGMRVARISENDLPCLLLQRVVSITTSVQLSKEYLFRLLSCQVFIDYFTPEVTGVSVPHISPEQISSFLIPLPPLNEQLLINDLIEQRTAEIDRMIQKVETAIEKLTEYRTALITAAVTGKIDVRKAS